MSEKAFQIDYNDPRTDRLILLLKDRGWLTRAQIHQATGWDVRLIRAIARATRGEIVSGQRGFCLTIQATQEDIEKSKAQTRSQIKAESEKLSDITHVQHRGSRRPHLFQKLKAEPSRELDLFASSQINGYGTGL